MKTFKRTPPEINTDLDNYNKFFNQFEFKGIVEPSNIFAVDENSFEAVKNVYVDEEQFVSRDSLQKDISVPKDAVPYLYELVDYLVIGDSELYINKNKVTNNIIINLFNEGNLYELTDITKYHISSIEHYIICFNDVDAKVFDAGDPTKGWQDFDKFVDIPVIKRVIGGNVSTYDKNQFTESYKEEYIWSNNSQPVLPTDNTDYTVKLNTTSREYDWTVSKINIATDYKLLRALNIRVQDSDLISVAKDIICIARNDYFLVSYNGTTFTTVYYPLYNGKFLNIASISEDGIYFFFVAEDGVYRCNLGNLKWDDKLTVSDIDGETTIQYSGINNICKFITGDMFVFLTYEPGSDIDDPGYNAKARLYWQGPGLYMGDDFTKDSTGTDTSAPYLGYTDLMKDNNYLTIATSQINKDCDSYRLFMYLSADTSSADVATICAIFNSDKLSTTALEPSNIPIYRSRFTVIRGGDTSAITLNNTMFERTWTNIVDTNLLSIVNGLILSGFDSKITDASFECSFVSTLLPNPDNAVNSNPWVWQEGTIKYIVTKNNFAGGDAELSIEYTRELRDEYEGAPLKMSGAYIASTTIWDDFNGNLDITNIPSKLDGQPFMRNNETGELFRRLTKISGDHFYMMDNTNTIYTNKLSDTDTATITYTYIAENDKFNKIPQVSYSDTELYLAFGDTLQITENNRDGTKILFNLPPKNNQSFITDITAMVNISTTEVAIFFENKIVICSKVEDENFGYRYDYYNTKLSLGVRLGDSAINTLEGSYTIFPTRRGLAVMNYQAFMATTDQTIEYISDDIKSIWNEFYKNGTVIKIIQWRNHLVFTNGTRQILLYRIEAQSWWIWEIPFNTQIAITDQLDLKVICRGELNIFTDRYITNNSVKELNYYDFSANGENIPIEWYVQSQPLHMNAPTYYKNLRQLIFQFFTNDEETKHSTMVAQIKLYRKKINLKEPEAISFKIERLRTFVKRFNYWKVNQLQWGLANDIETNTPAKFRLNGLTIKYEIGEEVR